MVLVAATRHWQLADKSVDCGNTRQRITRVFSAISRWLQFPAVSAFGSVSTARSEGRKRLRGPLRNSASVVRAPVAAGRHVVPRNAAVV